MMFISYAIWTCMMAFCLSLVRIVQAYFYFPESERERLTQTLITGFRFDLLIVGYWLAPIVVALVLKRVFLREGFRSAAPVRFYLLASWFLMVLIYTRDLPFFHVHREHMWIEDQLARPFLSAVEWTAPAWWAWVGFVILAAFLYQSAAERLDRQLQQWTNPSLTTVMLIFVWTAAISRGSLGQDHLRRNDCDYSPNRTVRSLCMNPIFTLTKSR